MLLYLLIAFGIFVKPISVNSQDLEKFKKSYVQKKIVNLQYPLVTESVPSFFLHLLKHKFKYQRLEKIPSTASTIDCICVPYYLCDRNLTIITNGLGNINERSRRCANELEICCKLPTTTNATMAPIVTPTMTTTTTMKPTTTTTTTTTTTPSTTTTTTTPSTTTTTTTTMKPTTTTTPSTTTTTTTPSTTTTTTTTMKPTTITTVQPTTAPPVVFPTPGVFPTPPANVNCYCVLISQCDPNGMIITSGSNAIDPRQQISLCPQPNQVCCTLPKTDMNPQVITVPQSICLLCTTAQCVSTVPGTGVIDPRLPGNRKRLKRNDCNGSPGCCSGGENTYSNSLGPLKNPGMAQACYCVKSWLCTEGNAVAPDGVGIIDPRFTLCTSEEDVCCKPNGIVNYRILSPKSIDNYIINPVKGGCGIRGTLFAPERPYPIDSGRTYFAEFPWMVALLTKQGTGPYVFRCGASMINNRALLTAAHCVQNQDINTLVARFGQWNIKNTKEELPFKETKIQAIITHPDFYSGGLYHDVSVIILSTSIAYELNIMPICLPQQGMLFVPGNQCYATGWGVNSPDSTGMYQDELHKVDLTIIDRLDCQNRLRNTKLGSYFQLHGSFICAGGEPNRDTCRGDGGGPLVCLTTSGQYIQAGIVSWGIGCGQSQPAVYTSVSQHRQWIDRQLATYGVF